VEGYLATGEHGTAHLVCSGIDATSFDEAVESYKTRFPNKGIERKTRTGFISDEAYEYRRSNWHIWSCSLFDNETDARRAFG
jgi:hypothetical protein